MLSSVIKTGAVIFITATTTFSKIPESQVENASNQSIKVIANKPKTTSINHKNSGYKQPTNLLRKKISGQYKKKPGYSSRRIKVSGYLGQTYVYGEVIPQKNGKLEGYIYHPDNSKTYVYGEQSNNRINLYDANGNLYQMLNQ